MSLSTATAKTVYKSLSPALSLSHLNLSPVPRSFKLRMELEFGEKRVTEQKGEKPDPHRDFISFGLGDLEEKGYEWQLCNWNATIIGPQNVSGHWPLHPTD